MRFCWFVLFCFFIKLIPAQNLDTLSEGSPVKVSFFASRDVPSLCNTLIAGKSSDKEKFDAIFYWVVTHLRYDYRQAYSNGGTNRAIKTILKHRYAVCLGYAELMDTLCRTAGLKSEVIYGYSKDDLFDVKDSLYFDDHAWNAVNLDGLWYLYDATWSSPQPILDFTKRSLRILKKRESFIRKFKTKQIRSFDPSFLECPGDTASVKTVYVKQRFFNKVKQFILFSRRIRVKYSYVKHINLDYYLTDPQLFAIDHYPDDPTWALTAQKSIQQYEGDSAYYHLDEKTYQEQNRVGVSCSSCDTYNASNTYDKWKILGENASKFNKRNETIFSLCKYYQAVSHYGYGQEAVDSATKVHNYDTSSYMLNKTLESMRRNYSTVRMATSLARKKNGTKMNILKVENTGFLTQIRLNNRRARTAASVMSQVHSKARNDLKSFDRTKNMYEKYKFVENEKVREGAGLAKKMKEAKDLLAITQAKLDSCALVLEKQKITFDSSFFNMSLNLNQQIIYGDTVFNSLYKSTFMRMKLLDNYKKPVVEARKKFKNDFYASNEFLYKQVLNPSDSVAKNYVALMKTFKFKHDMEMKSLRIIRDLVKGKQMAIEEFDQKKDDYLKELKENKCWLKYHKPKLSTVKYGFRQLLFYQKDYIGLVTNDNKYENLRFRAIDKKISSKRIRHNAINNANVKLSNRTSKIVMRAKKAYLMKLRKERQLAAREAKRKK